MSAHAKESWNAAARGWDAAYDWYKRSIQPLTDWFCHSVAAPGARVLDIACGTGQLVIGRSSTANAYCVPAEGMHVGRERGDIIFPDDGYVSGLHCRIHGEGGRIYLTDVGSSNGTFMRVAGQHMVQAGSMILIGQQLFRVEY